MSPWDRVIAACACTVALASGCVHPPRPSGAPERSARPVLAGGWSPVAMAPHPLMAVPAGLPVVGLGAKISPRGLLPKRCLSKAESSAEGGSFSVEVHAVSEPFQHGDLDVTAFVESGVRRAARARPTPGGVAPVSALLVVRTAGQWTTLNEVSATFSEEIGRLLNEGQDWDFFERCGTHYVHAARRELSALVFVALYPAGVAQRAELEARIARRVGAARDDLLTLRVLDQLVEQVPSFLAVRADADQALDVVELGLRRPAAGRTGALVGNALRASFGADRGRVVDVGLRPWSSLPAAGALWRDRREQLGAEPGRRERLFQHLKLLEDRALDRETLLAQVTEVAGAGTCKVALARSMSPFSWEGYYRCRTAARETLPAALEDIQACQPVLAALSSDRLPEVCERLRLDEGGFPDPRKRSDTRYPLLLERGDELQRRRQAEPDGHLHADGAQFVSAPSPVTVGAQTDRWGRARQAQRDPRRRRRRSTEASRRWSSGCQPTTASTASAGGPGGSSSCTPCSSPGGSPSRSCWSSSQGDRQASPRRSSWSRGVRSCSAWDSCGPMSSRPKATIEEHPPALVVLASVASQAKGAPCPIPSASSPASPGSPGSEARSRVC